MMEAAALGHLRVLELGGGTALSYAGKLLGDFGADVVKVEPPGGDPERRQWPAAGASDEESGAAFAYFNQNKRSCVVDRRLDPGQSVLLSLVRWADVLLTSIPELEAQHPEFVRDHIEGPAGRDRVTVSISPFGTTGPYATYKASELILQALGGLMSLTGYNDREPVRECFSQAGLWGGISGALATLVAVHERQRSGRGDVVNVSILECLASGLQSSLLYYSYMGATRGRTERTGGGLNQITPTADGYVVPMLGGYGDWQSLAAFFGSDELLDERFATNQGRLRNAPALGELLVQALSERTKLEVFHSAQEWGMPFGVVQTPEDLLRCPQLRERAFWHVLEGAGGPGALMVPGAPFRMSETPWAVRRGGPAAGQHTREVLRDICELSEAEVDDLVANGAAA